MKGREKRSKASSAGTRTLLFHPIEIVFQTICATAMANRAAISLREEASEAQNGHRAFRHRFCDLPRFERISDCDHLPPRKRSDSPQFHHRVTENTEIIQGFKGFGNILCALCASVVNIPSQISSRTLSEMMV
jgi:hypothetical protein